MFRIRTNKFTAFLMIVMICAFLSSSIVGCSLIQSITGSEDPIKNTYGVLYGTGSVYNMAMASVSLLQKQGVVTQAQRETINKSAIVFRTAYFVTVDSLVMWKLNQGTVNEKEIQTILENLMFGLSQNWAALQQAINAISPGLIQGNIKLALNDKVIVDSRNNPSLKGAKKDPKKLDPVLVPVIIEVIGLIVQYGIPEAMRLMEALKKPTITVDDIKALKDLVKEPATY